MSPDLTDSLGTVWYQAITWAIAYQVFWRHVESLGHCELKLKFCKMSFAHNCLEEGLIILWWLYQMETFSASLALCAGNSPVTGEFPTQKPVTRSFDVFFDLRLNKRLSKQSWG